MATPNGNGKPRSAQSGDRPVTDIDATTGAVDNSIPFDDGPADQRSQLTKLSLAMMGCQPELSLKKKRTAIINGVETTIEAGEKVHQATIFGQITSLTGPKDLPNAKPGQDAVTYGLVGMIEGLNVITGEMFKAGVLYLPAGFHDMFLSEMEAGLRDGGNTAIAFALDFYSIPASNPRGYSWEAKNKLGMVKTDPLARLRQRALQGVTIRALSAPEQAKAIA